ncbi:MAG TPA: prepilin-type N-terminal cleavage/methylation domain-containing protein [Acidobacteriota bacterium]|nr:prepilin-type N-terminal cleavage/methylation domain-containing protein [Acidobacteriota bacterium]
MKCDNRGFSILEMMVATLVFTLLLVPILMLFNQGQFTSRSQSDHVSNARQLRMAMNTITRYLRQAGSDPTQQLLAHPIEPLQEGQFLINSDLTGSVSSTTADAMESRGDPDGKLESIFEQVVIRFNPAAEQLFIDIGYGEEILAERITDFQVEFLSHSGAPAVDPEEIARVRIRMTGRGEKPDLQTGHVSTVTLASEVFVRSRIFQFME